MTSRARRVLALSILSLAFSGPAFAQATGTVSGRIVDQTGAALPGVTIDLTSGKIERTSITDAGGKYHIESAPAGPAELTLRLLNFAVQRRKVTVVPGSDTAVNLTMTLSLSADVIVTGTTTFRNIADIETPEVSLVGIAGAASQGAISAAQLQARPMIRPGEVLEAVPGMIVSQHS